MLVEASKIAIQKNKATVPSTEWMEKKRTGWRFWKELSETSNAKGPRETLTFKNHSRNSKNKSFRRSKPWKNILETAKTMALGGANPEKTQSNQQNINVVPRPVLFSSIHSVKGMVALFFWIAILLVRLCFFRVCSSSSPCFCCFDCVFSGFAPSQALAFAVSTVIFKG